MKVHILALYDKKAKQFLVPMFVPNVAMCVRDMTDEMRKSETAWARHPEDFELWRLGDWESDNGSWGVTDTKGITVAEKLADLTTFIGQ